jgi:hypothetical protein
LINASRASCGSSCHSINVAITMLLASLVIHAVNAGFDG